jgi:hypothetical protein
MEKFDQILGKAMTKRGLHKVTKGAMICFFAAEWGKGTFSPISFADGLLKLAVNSSPAASELQMKEQELIDHLNDRVGKKMIKKVRIYVKR